MDQSQYFEIINKRFKSCLDILTIKGKEYMRNNEPHHVFESIARRKQKHPLEVLDELNDKHLQSFYDMVEDVKAGKPIAPAIISEKITDLINYFGIAETIFVKHNEHLENKDISNLVNNELNGTKPTITSTL